MPHSVAKAAPIRIRLLSRKLDSRDTNESSSFSPRSSANRRKSRNRKPKTVRAMKARKYGPRLDTPKACTDSMMPLRVMKVPSSVSPKVNRMSSRFHTLSMPRRSWIMTECR